MRLSFEDISAAFGGKELSQSSWSLTKAPLRLGRLGGRFE
jgi:hypothetical protein